MSEHPSEEWISLSELARRRDVALFAVQKAITSGRIPAEAVRRDADGRITAVQYHAAMAGWAKNTDPVQAARSGVESAPPDPGFALIAPPGLTPPATAPIEPAASEEATSANAAYLEHRARSEEFRSKKAELDYLETVGRLVDVKAVEKAAFEQGRTLRERLLTIPDRIAARCAAEREPARVHAEILQELRTVLDELACGLTAAASPGGAV